MLDSDLVREKPPEWFWLIYDSLMSGVPVKNARSMRQLPFVWRFRIRAVKEILREVAFERSVRNRDPRVFIYNQF